MLMHEHHICTSISRQVELLALFSNPRVPISAPVQLRPLQLGQARTALLTCMCMMYVHVACRMHMHMHMHMYMHATYRSSST